MSSLENLQKKIQEKSKGSHVSILANSDLAKQDMWVDSGIYDLNRILTGNLFKSLPVKSLSMWIGNESSFKSSISAITVSKAQKEGFKPIIIDTEGAWSHNFCERWGVDINNALYIYEPFVEKINVILGQIIDDGGTDYILVLDSIGSIETKKLLDDATKGDVKDDQGSLQRRIKRTLKLILTICKRQNTIGIYTGHYYGNPSSYGSPEQVGGGKFAKLAPDIIVGFKNAQMKNNADKKEDEKVIGSIVKAITLKNRFYPRFQEAVINIDYQHGINKLAGLVDLAIEADLIEKKSSWYTIKSTQEKFQGAHNAEKYINNEMLKKINEWLANTGYSTINNNIEEAKKLMEDETKSEGE